MRAGQRGGDPAVVIGWRFEPGAGGDDGVRRGDRRAAGLAPARPVDRAAVGGVPEQAPRAGRGVEVVSPAQQGQDDWSATTGPRYCPPRPTSVTTTAAAALAAGYGVCQDFAHVMLALCHLVGLPARYVSGHLLGQGGTHAWVEVIVPRAGQAEAVAFDPCNGRRTDSGYVTVATGRDHSGVAPTTGSCLGTSHGQLTTARRVGILAAA